MAGNVHWNWHRVDATPLGFKSLALELSEHSGLKHPKTQPQATQTSSLFHLTWKINKYKWQAIKPMQTSHCFMMLCWDVSSLSAVNGLWHEYLRPESCSKNAQNPRPLHPCISWAYPIEHNVQILNCSNLHSKHKQSNHGDFFIYGVQNEEISR